MGNPSTPERHSVLQRNWSVCGEKIPEKDSYHHLGILRSVTISTLPRTSERCSSGRSAYFSLNAVGARFGCLHPITVLRLYKIYCLPILLYGAEIWHITKTELMMVERVHRKILRTILGMPVRCNSMSLLQALGVLNIKALIQQKQLNFLLSFSRLPPDSLPLNLLQSLLRNPPPTGLIRILLNTLHELCLPSASSVLSGNWSQRGWKNAVKNILFASQCADFRLECHHLPLFHLSNTKLGRVIPHITITRGFPQLTRKNSFRLKLFTNCHGLETELSRFRGANRDSTCRLCGGGDEDIEHFLHYCPALSSARRHLSSRITAQISPSPPPATFVDIILGTQWIDDSPLQRDIVEFVYDLYHERLRQLQQLIESPT